MSGRKAGDKTAGVALARRVGEPCDFAGHLPVEKPGRDGR